MSRTSSAPAEPCASSPSLWQGTAPAGPALEPLAGHAETDVLIVGGGIAGVSTALHLAEAGSDVLLVEAGELGSGATGQSGGLVAPDFVRHNPDAVGQALGRAAGERLTRFVGGSAQRCFELIARHGIDCDSRQDGFYSPVCTPSRASAQRIAAEQWRARGFDVATLDARETERMIGTSAYCGSSRFGQGGSLNPIAYVRGLARAAASAGAQLHIRTPVEALGYVGDRWQARTSKGVVSARRVVLAANGGNPGLHPAMDRSVLPLEVVEFATEPLSSDLRTLILPQGGAFTDKAPYIFTARYDGAGRLISAFPKSYFVSGQEAFRAEAKRRLGKCFKGLETVGIEVLWEGVAWINASFLPEVYDLGQQAYAIQACNGRGISINTAIGIELATALVTGDLEALSVRPRQPSPIRFYRGAKLLPKAMMTMAYLSD
ncbi:FAD-binding oxidoreductase [Sphingosinicella sp. CPCC 101087]|uniref:NAD(P)/FAD-dependent oxidoreductase n=1 Tax=Sphingosinicella sp. CPCC 101087 TaxID=2497754 RepID=UPI0013EC5ACF|nr:FAD-binding oxidoreductase [Sphingosinicella sp. CPCC 101087]